MMSFKIILILSMLSVVAKAVPQFWKMNTLSERDMFILDVKSTMPAGICYKKMETNANDPDLRLRTVSFCCDGYEQNALAYHSRKCDPICEEDCSNGICAKPDECECFPGYIRQGGRCKSAY